MKSKSRPDINWEAVVDNLRLQAKGAVEHAEALRKTMRSVSGDIVMEERAKTIERHRINGNFCLALADALEAGIEVER